MTAIQSPQSPVLTDLSERSHGASSHSTSECLCNSLTKLRKLLIQRTNEDVEREFGKDSMVVSSLAELERQEHRASMEIETYCCVLVNEEVINNHYLECDEERFLDWLLHLRFGNQWQKIKQQRVGFYLSDTVAQRRMKFLGLLQRALPESARAPLVLFRLFPRAVRIAAAMAFRDMQRAQALREEQIQLLPTIGYCHECHGRLMDCEESCRCCGNPIWTINWLQSD